MASAKDTALEADLNDSDCSKNRETYQKENCFTFSCAQCSHAFTSKGEKQYNMFLSIQNMQNDLGSDTA